MARRRLRAAVRKQQDREAQTIGSGVYAIARDLHGRRDLPLPVFLTAPLVYACEMMAGVICKRRGWGRDEADKVARYLMAGLSEFAVSLFSEFDEEHFEAWVAAAEHRQGET